MHKKKKYYHFELRELNYNLPDIYNLIIDNYLRNVILGIDSDILVISSKKEFHIFRSKVMLILEYFENLGPKIMNDNISNNSGLRKYLEHNTFNQKDIDSIFNNTLNKITRKRQKKDYYDILVLKEYVDVNKMKHIIREYAVSDKTNVKLLEHHFIYCFYLRRKLLKLSDFH